MNEDTMLSLTVPESGDIDAGELKINPDYYDDIIVTICRRLEEFSAKASNYDPNLPLTEERLNELIQRVADGHIEINKDYEYHFTTMPLSEISHYIEHEMGFSEEEAKQIAPKLIESMMDTSSFGQYDNETGELNRPPLFMFSKETLDQQVRTDTIIDEFIKDNY